MQIMGGVFIQPLNVDSLKPTRFSLSLRQRHRLRHQLHQLLERIRATRVIKWVIRRVIAPPKRKLLAGVCLAGAASDDPKQQLTIPVRILNESSMNALLDTGSRLSFISRALVQQWKLPLRRCSSEITLADTSYKLQ